MHLALDCGTPPVLGSAIPLFDSRAATTYGSSMLRYTCELGNWFSRSKMFATASCGMEGIWIVNGNASAEAWPSCYREYSTMTNNYHGYDGLSAQQLMSKKVQLNVCTAIRLCLAVAACLLNTFLTTKLNVYLKHKVWLSAKLAKEFKFDAVPLEIIYKWFVDYLSIF